MSSDMGSERISVDCRSADEHRARALAAVDEQLASGCAATLLISASTERGMETLARRIHSTGPRASCPFLHVRAGDFPVEPQALREYCSGVVDRAAGGTLLIGAVEQMPPVVQDTLIELLAAPELTRTPSDAVRLIAGTTVSLLDRIAAGTFSDQLFYRLNVIHLRAADHSSYVTSDDDDQDVQVIDLVVPELPR